MKKILVISWFYPPINSSEGLVTFKLLNNSKYKYDVFTQNNNSTWSYGDNVELHNNKNVNSIYSKSNNYDDWINEAVEYFRKNHSHYDIIMTRAMPKECHIVGLKIKKEFPNVKWIASFGDPIKNNPYNYISCYLYSKDSIKNIINKNMLLRDKLSLKRILKCAFWNYRYRNNVKLRKFIDKLEDQTLKLADYIILNNESQKKYMLKDNETYLKKSIVIPHSYDSNFYTASKRKTKKEKLSIVFTGHLDDVRTPISFLNALALLKKEIPDLSNKLEVNFYGDLDNSDKVYLIDNDLLDVVKLKMSTSYLESLKIMQDADWLLHVDANITNAIDENIFFAAKVADYFGSQSQIMAITMQNGAVHDELIKANALVLSYSAEEIKNYLYLIINEGYTKQIDKKYVEKYDAKNVAQEFDKIIDKITQE